MESPAANADRYDAKCISCSERLVPVGDLMRHICRPKVLVLDPSKLSAFTKRGGIKPTLHCPSCECKLGRVIDETGVPCPDCGKTFATMLEVVRKGIVLSGEAERKLVTQIAEPVARGIQVVSRSLLKRVSAIAPLMVTKADDLPDELTCSICYELYCEPVSLLCGHSYCSECFDGLRRNNIRSCPLCRSALPPSLSKPAPNITLRHVLKVAYPALYEQRLAARKQKVEPKLSCIKKIDRPRPVLPPPAHNRFFAPPPQQIHIPIPRKQGISLPKIFCFLLLLWGIAYAFYRMNASPSQTVNVNV